MKPTLLILGSLLPAVSTVVYAVSILRGKSRPQRMTRLLMAVIGALSLAALLAAHDRAGMWLALVSFVQAVVLWVLSLRRGIGGRDRLDLICFGLCVVGAALWLASGQSLFGLVMSIVADIVACIPSLRKTMRLPHTESLAFYTLDVIAGACIALAAPRSAAALLYPLYIMLANAIFVAVIWWPRRPVPDGV